METREQRGLVIAALAKIKRERDFYIVPSQSRPTRYHVTIGTEEACDCPDFETRRSRCKHIYAVRFVIQRKGESGTYAIIGTVDLPSPGRKTYKQDWAAYNEAQVNEKRQFLRLLHALCCGVAVPPELHSRNGRPRLPLSDALFASIFKIYSTISARRFSSDLEDAHAKGYIQRVPHFNSVLNYLEMPELTPLLMDMIITASMPLRSLESNFAVDSTGFTGSRFARWFDVKYNRFTKEQQWVKAHLMCGVKTNVVTAIEIHERDAADAPILPSLVASTAERFNVKEVMADKGYTGRPCHDAIASVGATPYIAFKINATGAVGGIFEKMWHYFSFHQEEFLAHYHQRSNIESTVMMIKTKFGDSLRSKTDTAMRNEVLAKVLCHNLCCLISAVYELGIEFPGLEAT